MGNPARNQVLVVGDHLESDTFFGGDYSGLDPCWINVDKKETPTGIAPRYQVTSLDSEGSIDH